MWAWSRCCSGHGESMECWSLRADISAPNCRGLIARVSRLEQTRDVDHMCHPQGRGVMLDLGQIQYARGQGVPVLLPPPGAKPQTGVGTSFQHQPPDPCRQ